MKWKGPFTIDELLDGSVDLSIPELPESGGVYLISERIWDKAPTQACIPLYVGSNTGKSSRFRTRVGDLIADMFGFFGADTGHHSGGQTLHDYCGKRKMSPKRLYIGWVEECGCARCVENEIYNQLRPSLNKNRPTRCAKHQ